MTCVAPDWGEIPHTQTASAHALAMRNPVLIIHMIAMIRPGSSYAGSWSSVSSASNLAADAPVSISLFRDGVEMRRTRAGTNRRLETRPCPSADCRINFERVWTGTQLDGQSGQQFESSADGGGNLSISGFGFNLDQQYFCAFADGVGNNVTSDPMAPDSLRTLHCTVPEWPHPAARCFFTLHVLYSNGQVLESLELGRISSGNSLFTLTYLPEWYKVTPTMGPAKGSILAITLRTR